MVFSMPHLPSELQPFLWCYPLLSRSNSKGRSCCSLSVPLVSRPWSLAYPDHSPLRQLEHELHPTVAFVILPLFAFANAGVPLAGMTIKALFEPVSLGIILGLFVGKQLGVFSFAWLAIKLKLASLPDKVSWTQLYGAAVLCGIGFTMSLFIASLAFEHEGQEYIRQVRLGILVASLMAAVAGYMLLRFTQKKKDSNQ